MRLADGQVRAWRPENPRTPRLRLGTDSPADLGWLVFADEASR